MNQNNPPSSAFLLKSIFVTQIIILTLIFYSYFEYSNSKKQFEFQGAAYRQREAEYQKVKEEYERELLDYEKEKEEYERELLDYENAKKKYDEDFTEWKRSMEEFNRSWNTPPKP